MTPLPAYFIQALNKNTSINDDSGDLRCNKCNGVVHIDWFEHIVECPCDDCF